MEDSGLARVGRSHRVIKLSREQSFVAIGLEEGLDTKELAEIKVVSTDTIKETKRNIAIKLGEHVRSTGPVTVAKLVAAIRNGRVQGWLIFTDELQAWRRIKDFLRKGDPACDDGEETVLQQRSRYTGRPGNAEIDLVLSETDEWLHKVLHLPAIISPGDTFYSFVHERLIGKRLPSPRFVRLFDRGFMLGGFTYNGRDVWLKHEIAESKTTLIYSNGAQALPTPLAHARQLDRDLELSVVGTRLVELRRPGDPHPVRLGLDPDARGYICHFLEARSISRRNIKAEREKTLPLWTPAAPVVYRLIHVDDQPVQRERFANIAERYGLPLQSFPCVDEAVDSRMHLSGEERVLWLVDLGNTCAGGPSRALGCAIRPSPNETDACATLEVLAAIGKKWPWDRILQLSRLFTNPALDLADRHGREHICLREVEDEVFGIQLAMAARRSSNRLTTPLAAEVMFFSRIMDQNKPGPDGLPLAA